MNLQDAIAITNEIHQHAKLTRETAMHLLEDTGAESHQVRQTLIGAMNRPKPTINRKPKNHATNRRKTKRTLKGNK